MKKIIFSTMIASLLAFVGCQNEELVNDNNTDNSGKKVILTANIQGAADSRVALTPETSNGATTVKVEWNGSGEKFKVYGYDNEESYFCGTPTWFTQIEGTNLFEGTLPESDNGTYLAVYGDEEEGTDNPIQYQFSVQDGTLEALSFSLDGVDIYNSYVLMQAEFSEADPSITFQHQTAILKPTFTVGTNVINNTITHILMGNVSNPNTLVLSEDQINIASIEYGLGDTSSTLGEDIYIHLPMIYVRSDLSVDYYPAQYQFTFNVTDKQGQQYTGSLTIPDGKSIVAGKLYTATIELTEAPSVNYVWTSDIIASTAVSGEGTEASPYLIHSANDLQWMIDQVNTNGVTGKYFQLTHDLEIDSEEGATWTPIGTSSSPFVGYFDGGGCTISGEMHTTTDLVGFFGYNAGTISNLKNTAEVKDCRTLMPASIEYSAIGSIAGYSTGKIINCENSGNVTAPSIFTTTYTGGICGYQYGELEDVCAFILECKNSGAVTGVAGVGNATGGIVGQSSRIEESYDPVVCASENTGSVKNGQYLGGICGYTNETLMVACRNLGEVKQADGVYSGGIVGYAYAQYRTAISGCYTTIGYVSGNRAEGIEYASYSSEESDFSDIVDIIGPWNDPYYFGADDEMNYAIVQYNGWFFGNGCVCNWHWEIGENNLPVLVVGAPLGRMAG